LGSSSPIGGRRITARWPAAYSNLTYLLEDAAGQRSGARKDGMCSAIQASTRGTS